MQVKKPLTNEGVAMSIQSEINSVVRVLEEIQHRRARITDSLDECRWTSRACLAGQAYVGPV